MITFQIKKKGLDIITLKRVDPFKLVELPFKIHTYWIKTKWRYILIGWHHNLVEF